MSFFEAEDFYYGMDRGDGRAEFMADKANRILQERGVRVRTDDSCDKGFDKCAWYPKNYDTSEVKATALLVCIEELPKKECEHDAFVDTSGALHINWPPYCLKCGAKLKVKYEVCDDSK